MKKQIGKDARCNAKQWAWASRSSHQRLLAMLWSIWAVALLTIYYRRIWKLVSSLAWGLPVPEAFSPVLLTVLGAGVVLLASQVLGIGLFQLLRWHPKNWRQGFFYRTVAGCGVLACFLTIHSFFRLAPLTSVLPHLEEAWLRMLLAVFGAGLVLLAAQVLGRGICWLLRWRPEDWREGLLYQITTGLGAIAYLSLGLAGLGLYYAISLQILVAVVLLSGSFWLGWNRLHPGKLTKASVKSTLAGSHRLGDSVWKAIALLAVLIALIAALAPEQEYDALWYHLGLPKLWLEQGYLVDLPAEYVSLYPMTWELIFGAGLALGGPIAAKLLHFACLPLTGLLTYQLTWRFMPRSSPWLAVAFFVTIPIVLWEASTTYIDLALAMHVGLVIYALLRYVEGQRWQWLVLAALNLGLALATKHLALFILALATSGLALRLWLEERNLRRALMPAVMLGLLSLLLPLPWYIRSWLASANPVFPELFGIFGAPLERWDAVTEQGLEDFLVRFGRPRTAFNLLTLPWDMTVHAAHYGGTLGPMFALLLPALVLLRRHSQSTPWLMSFVLLYIGLWASPISSFQMRFLVPIAPLLAVLTAEACARLALPLRTFAKWGGGVLYGCVAVLLSLNLPIFTSLHEGDRVNWDGWLTHVIRQVPIAVVVGRESPEDYLVRSVPSYAAWRYINTHLPTDARVLTFSGGDHFYSDRQRIWNNATIARPAVWGTVGSQEEQALQNLLKLGISHVLFDKQKLKSPKYANLAIAQPSMQAKWYDLEYEDDRFVLYRIRWE